MSVSSISGNAGAAQAALLSALNNAMQADMAALSSAVEPTDGAIAAPAPTGGNFDAYA